MLPDASSSHQNMVVCLRSSGHWCGRHIPKVPNIADQGCAWRLGNSQRTKDCRPCWRRKEHRRHIFQNSCGHSAQIISRWRHSYLQRTVVETFHRCRTQWCVPSYLFTHQLLHHFMPTAELLGRMSTTDIRGRNVSPLHSSVAEAKAAVHAETMLSVLQVYRKVWPMAHSTVAIMQS